MEKLLYIHRKNIPEIKINLIKQNFSIKKLIFISFFFFGILTQIKSQSTKGEMNFGNLTNSSFQYEVSSTMSDTYEPFHLFDSNPTTHWMSAKSNNPEWILTDFQEKRLINRVDLYFPSWNIPSIKKYEIQINQWGEWKTIIRNEKVLKENSHLFIGIDASMIRIYFPEASERHLVVSDFKIYLENSLLNGIPQYLTGYTFPIQNGLLPKDSYSLPGAARSYRNGYHKGVDIKMTQKDSFSPPMPLTFNTDVLAVSKGKIIRADLDYISMTIEEFENQKNLTSTMKVTYVDRDFGGRQIWIDHGNGVITTYNHLKSIDPKIKIGSIVKQGQVIGKAGNSGLKGDSEKTEEGIHLHFEIWVKGEFLGKGLNATQSYRILENFFKPF
jgi:murein DD-endopeptidase MepM/ murein hydrolase activator NlpD